MGRSPSGTGSLRAGRVLDHGVIDPRDTRSYLKQMLAVHCIAPEYGKSQRLLSNWPTSY